MAHPVPVFSPRDNRRPWGRLGDGGHGRARQLNLQSEQMAKIILMMLLTAVATNAMAEKNGRFLGMWEKVGESNGVTLYANPDTIERDGDTVKVWSLIDYRTSQPLDRDSYLSAKLQDSFNCQEGKVRILNGRYYPMNWGYGQSVNKDAIVSEWSPIVSNSKEVLLFNYACGKK